MRVHVPRACNWQLHSLEAKSHRRIRLRERQGCRRVPVSWSYLFRGQEGPRKRHTRYLYPCTSLSIIPISLRVPSLRVDCSVLCPSVAAFVNIHILSIVRCLERNNNNSKDNKAVVAWLSLVTACCTKGAFGFRWIRHPPLVAFLIGRSTSLAVVELLSRFSRALHILLVRASFRLRTSARPRRYPHSFRSARLPTVAYALSMFTPCAGDYFGHHVCR